MWHSWTCLRCASSAAVKQRASSCFIARRTSGSGWTESGAERSEDHGVKTMEGYQAMGHQGTRPAAPPAQLGTQALDPQPTSARIDRDSQLVDALRVGAATAADLLVATYGDRAYRLAIGITRNEQDAEEAVHDTVWSGVRMIVPVR